MAAKNIFLDIVQGKSQAQIVYEDDLSLAFLDHRPLFPGHVLLIPREHFVTILDTPDDLVSHLFTTAKILSAAVQEALGCEGIFMAVNNVVSQSVPHLHIHIVPRTKGDGLKGFFWPRHNYRDDKHREEIKNRIMAAIEKHKSSSRHE
jgi:histidine triad (HIT) family protein